MAQATRLAPISPITPVRNLPQEPKTWLDTLLTGGVRITAMDERQAVGMNLSWASVALLLTLLVTVGGGIATFSYMAGQVAQIEKRVNDIKQDYDVERLKFEQDRQAWAGFMGEMRGRDQKKEK